MSNTTEYRLLDPARYEAPADVYEDIHETVAIEQVGKGARIGDWKVAEIKSGPKWVRLFDEHGSVIVGHKTYGAERGTMVSVTYRKRTKESVEAGTRAFRNQRILDSIMTRTDSFTKAKAEFDKQIEEYGRIDHWKLEKLISAEAELAVWNRFAGAVCFLSNRGRTEQSADLEPFEGDLVDAMAEFRESLVEEVLGTGERVLSRSTSTVSNLLEDVERAARLNFIQQSKRWF